MVEQSPQKPADHAGRRVEPFRAISIGRRAFELAAAGRSILHMEYGMPSAGPPPQAIARAHEALQETLPGYWESEALKQALAARYRDDYGVDVEPARIILTCGASPALVLALATRFSPGERIAFARPGYIAYRNVTLGLHLEPVEIECGPDSRYQLTAAQIAALDPAPHGVILSSPANPTGSIIPDEEMQAVASLCAERGILMISDEIYHRLTYGAPARSALEFSDDAMVVGSFSKYYCMPGWRLGWLIAPLAEIDPVTAYMGNFFLTPPTLSQHIALSAMQHTEDLERQAAIYRANRETLLEALPRLGLSSFAPPDGAFYFYVDISHLTDDSLGFCLKMLEETGVATASGIDFDPVNGNRFIRFSFAVETHEVEEALSRLEAWLPRQG